MEWTLEWPQKLAQGGNKPLGAVDCVTPRTKEGKTGAQPEFGGPNRLTPPPSAVSLCVFVVLSPALKSSVPHGPGGQACSVRPELPLDGWGVRSPPPSPAGLPDVGDSCA